MGFDCSEKVIRAQSNRTDMNLKFKKNEAKTKIGNTGLQIANC